jgi:hypothetical protein
MDDEQPADLADVLSALSELTDVMRGIRTSAENIEAQLALVVDAVVD